MKTQFELDMMKSMAAKRELVRQNLREQGYDVVDGVVTELKESQDETRPRYT